VQALVGVMGDLGAGVFELANDLPPDGPLRQDYFLKLRDLAVTTARPMTFVVAQSTDRPELGPQFLALLAEGERVGARMVGQVHARDFVSVIGFQTSLPFDKLPTWREVRSGSLAEQRAALTDSALRSRLVDEAMHGRFAAALGTEVRPPRYDILRVLDRPEGPWRTVADVAAERGCTPVDAMIDLSLEANFERFFAQPFANQDLDWVVRFLRDPHTVIATSDSGAHVSQISDASIPTFLLSHWVRREGVFSWEQAVRMLTFDPASLWRLRGRGLVVEGWFADLVVFDSERIGPELPTVDSDLPGGAKRLKQRARGILATVVNGEVVLRDGEHTGALPGKLLRGPLAE
jgi:N-acyl-D-aspartate/D-glutamate deacylase